MNPALYTYVLTSIPFYRAVPVYFELYIKYNARKITIKVTNVADIQRKKIVIVTVQLH